MEIIVFSELIYSANVTLLQWTWNCWFVHTTKNTLTFFSDMEISTIIQLHMATKTSIVEHFLCIALLTGWLIIGTAFRKEATCPWLCKRHRSLLDCKENFRIRETRPGILKCTDYIDGGNCRRIKKKFLPSEMHAITEHSTASRKCTF